MEPLAGSLPSFGSRENGLIITGASPLAGGFLCGTATVLQPGINARITRYANIGLAVILQTTALS